MPRRGGVLQPAAGDTLHVEAMWAEQRRLRVFVWDATGAPLPVERLREFAGTVRAADRESPLRLIEVDGFYEARIATLSLPATVEVELQPSPGDRTERLSFTFEAYSVDRSGLMMTAPIEIPPTLKGILDALAENRRELRTLVERGEFMAVYGPDDRIRDLVLATEPYVAQLPEAAQRAVEAVRTDVIRTGWLLHTAIDYGGEAQARAAAQMFDAGLDRLAALFSGIAR